MPNPLPKSPSMRPIPTRIKPVSCRTLPRKAMPCSLINRLNQRPPAAGQEWHWKHSSTRG